MPNAIKYSVSSETLALKKGDFYIGTNDVGKGPTSSTGYYNGITPSVSGYTIYLNKESNGPSIYTVATDGELVSLTNTLAGASYTTIGDALNYYNTQTDKMVLNMDYPAIVTSGLVFNLDAGFTPSYPTINTTWYDISSGVNNGTLFNGPTYSSSNGGSIVFDGSNDYFRADNNTTLDNQTITMESWNYPNTLTQDGFLFEKGQVNTQYSNFYNSDGTFYFRTVGLNIWDLTIYGPSYLSANVWNHIVCTYGAGTKTIYINGVQIAQQTGLTGTISTNTTGLYVGAYGPGSSYFFNGKIAVSRVYNKSLSATEILQNFNVQKTRFGL
jgi:hypothetical protein